jgi:hypothetical protein
MVFQEPQVSLLEKQRNLGKRGCNCQFCNHKTFNPHKHRTAIQEEEAKITTIQPSDLFMFCASV